MVSIYLSNKVKPKALLASDPGRFRLMVHMNQITDAKAHADLLILISSHAYSLASTDLLS